MKIALIGGGVSNAFAALNISSSNDITIFEKENKILKKVLLTGNGKCNIWNKKLNEEILDLESVYNTDNYDVLNKILANRLEVFEYLVSDLGMFLKAKGDYFYPYSKNAASIREFLVKKLNEKENINIKTETEIIKIEKRDNKYILYDTDNNEYLFDKVIIGTSLKSSNMGSDSIYALIVDNIVPLKPALVPIKLDAKYLKEWTNIRCDANLILKACEKEYIETGELQLTDYGLSGIAALNLSSKINNCIENKKEFSLSIDFMPDYTKSELVKLFEQRKNTSIEQLLETIFHYRLSFLIIEKSKLSKEMKWIDCDDLSKQRLIDNIKEFKINAVGTLDFDRSQVTSGGISLNAIENYSLKNDSNIYVVGEALNVDGICGGFNLAFAIISGYNAGKSI